MIDLDKFCSEDENRLTDIGQPWSIGDYTCATDGVILIPADRRADVPENDEAPRYPDWWNDFDAELARRKREANRAADGNQALARLFGSPSTPAAEPPPATPRTGQPGLRNPGAGLAVALRRRRGARENRRRVNAAKPGAHPTDSLCDGSGNRQRYSRNAGHSCG